MRGQREKKDFDRIDDTAESSGDHSQEIRVICKLSLQLASAELRTTRLISRRRNVPTTATEHFLFFSFVFISLEIYSHDIPPPPNLTFRDRIFVEEELAARHLCNVKCEGDFNGVGDGGDNKYS